VKRGDVQDALIYAVRAGSLFREARIHDLSVEDGRNKKVRQPDPDIARWVAMRRRVKPDLTYADLSDELERTDDAEPIVIGESEIYLEEDRIMVSRTKGGVFEDAIALISLKRYLTGARKPRKTR